MVDYLVCPICGASKKNLTKHVNMLHGLSKEEFLMKFPGTKMVSDSTSESISESLRNNWKDPSYAERCSSYWRSELHARRKSAEMKRQWADPDWRCNSLTKIRDFANSDEGRTIRSNNLTNSLNKLWDDPDYVTRRRESGQIQMLINMASSEFNKYSRTEYNGVNYRSKLEVLFAKEFDKLNIDYEYESVRLTYLDTETKFRRVYIPDFYLPDYNLLVEVKPSVFVDNIPDGKLSTALNSNYNFTVLTELELSTLNIMLPIVE